MLSTRRKISDLLRSDNDATDGTKFFGPFRVFAPRLAPKSFGTMTTLNAGYPVFCGAATRLPHAEAEDQRGLSAAVQLHPGGRVCAYRGWRGRRWEARDQERPELLGAKSRFESRSAHLVGAAAATDRYGESVLLGHGPGRHWTTLGGGHGQVTPHLRAQKPHGAASVLLCWLFGSPLKCRECSRHERKKRARVGEISLCAPGEEKATAEVVEIAFDGGGHIVVVGFANGVLQAFDLQNAESLRQALFKKEGKGGDLPDARLQQLWRKNVDDSQIMALTFSAEPEWPLEAEEGPLLLSATKDGKLRVWIADDNGAEERLLVDVGERMPPKKGQGKVGSEHTTSQKEGRDEQAHEDSMRCCPQVFCRGAAWLRYQGPGDPSDKTEEAVIHVAAGLGPARGPTFIGIWEVKGNKSEALSSNCVGLVKNPIWTATNSRLTISRILRNADYRRSVQQDSLMSMGAGDRGGNQVWRVVDLAPVCTQNPSHAFHHHSDGFVFCMSYDEVGKLVPVFRTRQVLVQWKPVWPCFAFFLKSRFRVLVGQPNHSFPVTTLAFPRLPNNLDPEEEDPTSGMLWTLASASPDYNVALMQPSFGEGDGTCGSAILGFMCYLVIAIIIATVAFTAMVSVDPTARQSLENFLRANEEDEEIQAEL
eukprot:scaffold719_cov226-Pinguiococcus_pyrenoidosus.AAC.5